MNLHQIQSQPEEQGGFSNLEIERALLSLRSFFVGYEFWSVRMCAGGQSGHLHIDYRHRYGMNYCLTNEVIREHMSRLVRTEAVTNYYGYTNTTTTTSGY